MSSVSNGEWDIMKGDKIVRTYTNKSKDLNSTNEYFKFNQIN